jgi:hypothetical protein
MDGRKQEREKDMARLKSVTGRTTEAQWRSIAINSDQ